MSGPWKNFKASNLKSTQIATKHIYDVMPKKWQWGDCSGRWLYFAFELSYWSFFFN
jgi:hypothetical protein